MLDVALNDNAEEQDKHKEDGCHYGTTHHKQGRIEGRGV